MVQSVSSVAQRSLETIVRNEFKHNVTPVVQQSVNQLKSQMQTDVSQRLTCTDTVIKDQIGRIVRSKQTTEAIGVAVAGAIQNPIQSQLREVFQQRVAPAFEHSTQTLANQVNTAFQDGTREYTNQLKKHLEKVRQEQQQARDPILQQMSSLMDSFKQNTQHMQAQLVHTLKTETSAQIKAALGSFQEQVNSGLRAAIRDEVSMAMAEQGSKMTDSLQTYLRSGAATPAPTTPDMNTVQALQDQIKSLVNKGKFNDAFLTALQAGNLEVTVYTCELVNPTTLFGSSTCPLTQPVLLSLVQQLSAELSSHFATKLNYLIEAVMVLKPNDPVTHEHVPSVMELLITKLRTYQANNPPNKDLRVLLMAATALAQQAGTS